MTISVIIPTLNAEKEIRRLIETLRVQTVVPDEILVIDSQSEDRTLEECGLAGGVRTVTIQRKDFKHGATRDFAFRMCDGDYVLFFTQDTLPCNSTYIEKIIQPFTSPKVAAVYGRQIAKPDAPEYEKLVRSFHYPFVSTIHSKEDIPRLGIKTFYLSNTCSAYRRDVYEKLGGFEADAITNEDMLFAAKAIQRGYQIAYSSEAKVFHSHNFSLREQYTRNFRIGYELERRHELLGDAPQVREGARLFHYVSVALLGKGKICAFFRFGLDCCARLLGNRAGKRAFRRKQRFLKKGNTS